MNDIQSLIADYLESEPPDRQPSKPTLCTFAGMIETGEAVPEDFDAVRNGLSDAVVDFLNYLRKQREATQ